MYLNSLKLNISAIVVGYNEATLLKGCLNSVSFCDEILYYDLGSTDNSIEIATSLNANVIKHDKVPGCEWIHSKYYRTTKHDWVLIIDPDETINESLIDEITALFKNDKINHEIGAIHVPEIYYFKNHRLKGTPWGIDKSRVLIVNKHRFEFLPIVHMGRRIKDGYKPLSIKYTGTNFINHYWMSSYSQLLEKHLRYLKNEGNARVNNGDIVGFKKILITPFKQFLISFILMKGYRDLFVGFFLSLFWAWYQTAALIELYKVQKLDQP